MSGITIVQVSNSILSASAVTGPFANSNTYFALISFAFVLVI
jgi:hypothetical protein